MNLKMNLAKSNSFGLTVIALLLIFAASGMVNGQTAVLNGEPAIKQLREAGAYDSLRAAFDAARGGDGGQSLAAAPQNKLLAADGSAGEKFGSDIAVSGDTVIVGDRFDNIGSRYAQGSAYVFVKNGSGWTQQAKLVAADGAANNNFGSVVAISGDTVAVSSLIDALGKVYIYVRSGTTWTQQTIILPPDYVNPDRMFATDLALEGNTLVIGAEGKSSIGTAALMIFAALPTFIPETERTGRCKPDSTVI